MSHKYPKIVEALVNNHDAWIIGSAADPDKKDFRDIDVVVPFWSWGPASSLIPVKAKPNTFGGWKIIDEGIEVDIWPGDIGWLMLNNKAKYAYQPRYGVRLMKLKD